MATTQQLYASAQFPGIPEEAVEAHYSLMPGAYFLETPAQHIHKHLQGIQALFQQIHSGVSMANLQPVLQWGHVPVGSEAGEAAAGTQSVVPTLTLITWDRPGLFYKAAAAFTLAGLEIVRAHTHTRADHVAMDTFYLKPVSLTQAFSTQAAENMKGMEGAHTEMEGVRLMMEPQQATFASTLRSILIENVNPMPQLPKLPPPKNQTPKNPQASQPPVPLNIHIESVPRSSAQAQETAQAPETAKNSQTAQAPETSGPPATQLTITCTDQPGLLAHLAHIMYTCGLDIQAANIQTTQAGVVTDTFTLTPQSSRPSRNPFPLEAAKSIDVGALREKLMAALQG